MLSSVKVPIAFVTLVDSNGQMPESSRDLDTQETQRAMDICSSVSGIVVSDLRRDLRFSGNPLVTGPTSIRFYACAPITIDNIIIGNLCILDTVPRFDFDMRCQMSLLDISGHLAELIGERRKNKLHAPAQKAKSILNTLELTVPIPYDEEYRLRVLRETGLLENTTNDHNFDNITCLCQRLFTVKKYTILYIRTLHYFMNIARFRLH